MKYDIIGATEVSEEENEENDNYNKSTVNVTDDGNGKGELLRKTIMRADMKGG